MTTVIVKPTEQCNARCLYCAAASGPKGRMHAELLEPLFCLFRSWCLRRKEKRICFIWHGGEPLLMPDTFWNLVLAQQEQVFRPLGIEVVNRMQANLTLLRPERIFTLKRLLGKAGAVGTSIELLPGIRELAAGPPGQYRKRLEKAIDLLREHRIRFGFIYVVHRLSLPKLTWIYQELRRRYPEAGLRFNVMYREGRARRKATWDDLGLSARAWGEALCELYRIWTEDGRPRQVQPLAPWQKLYQTGAWRLSCECSGRCVQSHFGVDPQGTVYLCGRAADAGAFRLGSIECLSAEQLARSPVRDQLANRACYLRQTHCRTCAYWRFCHGGCITEAASTRGSPFAPTSLCEGLKAFFERAFPLKKRHRAGGLTEKNSRPHPAPITVTCHPHTDLESLRKAVLMASASGKAVLLENLDCLASETAGKLVRFFLHDPGVTKPLVPLSPLLEALSKRKGRTLWSLTTGRERDRAEVAFLARLPQAHRECLSCRFFTHCAGYGAWRGTCRTWQAIFTELLQARRKLRSLKQPLAPAAC